MFVFNVNIDEGTMVGDVARYISRRVTLMRKIDSENLVGVKAHVDGINTLLDLNSNKVCLIQGIWGMGGICKTTIAKCLFDKLSPEFPARCFLENIRRNCKDDDLVHLQKQLLNSIFPTSDDFELWSVEAGRVEIKCRLDDKKVLIVLDGVDKVTQVQALAENISWFGPGSRIIITTRDRGLLTKCRVGAVYEVMCLDDKDSLRMFQQIAFGGETPPHGLEQLIVRASRLAHGLPSALQAYALFFSGISDSLEVWEESMRGLERNLDEDIMKILKVSYDGLSTPTKKAFLHVACLFNSETLNRVVSLLDGSIPETSLSIRFLQEKSLIKVSSNGCVIMHKLVEKMGRKIMHDCRKFLCDAEEIRDALISEDGTKETECMSLHTCDMAYDLSLPANFVYHMWNLKFLKIYKHLEDAKSMLRLIKGSNPSAHHNLRLFHWDAYPSNVFPLEDNLSGLVELNLRHSNLVKLWSGKPVFRNFKRLDVTGLPEIPYRIHLLKLLERLDLSGNCFRKLPENMVRLVRLKTLWLRNCYNLKELPLLPQVQTLTLSNCTNLISIVDLSLSSSHLESYCLLELCLENCNKVESLSDQLKYFKRLTYLNLSRHEFVTLPSSIRDLTSLVTLCVNNCKNLLSLEELPLSLQFLDSNGCDSLEVDSAQHFEEAIPRNACFEETEIPCYVSKQQTTRSHRTIFYLPEITDACKFLSIPIFIMLIAIVIILLRQ